MKTIFIEAKAEGIELPYGIIKSLPERIALAATVQFTGNIEKIKEDIEKSGRQVILYLGLKSAYPGQILGCDVETLDDAENIDAFLFIGDGLFHPKMLVIKNNITVFAYDPFSEKFDRIEKTDVDRMLKRGKGSMIRFLSSDEIGIIVSTKTGQYYNDARKRLEDKYPDKNFYTFLSDTIDFSQMENFPFIQAWVNTACPRIGYDDASKFKKSIVNISHVLDENPYENET